MTRTRAQVVAAMADAARLAPFEGDVTWREALFEPGPEGHRLSRPADPDRVLLAAIADEVVEVDRHAATLASRLHVAWLDEILGIPRLPVVPDRVVARVSADVRTAPAVIPVGTLLRGGKDAAGDERRYRTLDALTAHGTTVSGVRLLVPGGPPAGAPGVALAAPEFPVTPPTTAVEAAVAPAAPHVLRIHSSALAFGSGDMTVAITFLGATDVRPLRGGASWRWPRPDGSVSDGTPGTGSGPGVVQVAMSGGCVDPAGGDPWIECVLAPTTPVPEALSFTEVRVAVIARAGVVPDAAFANDGRVDLAKEFEPFLATARAGDAFYVRSDEVFAKSLDTLSISMTTAVPGSGGVPSWDRVIHILSEQPTIATAPTKHLASTGTRATKATKATKATWSTRIDKGFEVGDLWAAPTPATSARLEWQRLIPSGWHEFASRSTFGGVNAVTIGAGPPASLPSAVAGQAGHYVRAYLDSGDFGWSDYLQQVSSFATIAVRTPDAVPAMPTAPVAAKYAGLALSYTTSPVAATRVESWSGWRHAERTSGSFTPFRRAVDAEGHPGMVAIGLDAPASITGSTVSVHIVLDSAAPCGSTAPVSALWQWWDGAVWQPLAVSDGTHGLREAGLLRFVAPDGWWPGCEDVSSPTGRWIRFVTDQPRRIGVLRDVVTDAVLAEFVSRAADPQLDPSPATALPPGTIKGTVTPVAGVKKVTNVDSVRGRGPEDDAAYATRASALVRHRGRALTPWDYEQTVALAFPDVALLRCLPHTDSTGSRAPGTVGLVVVPDRPDHPQPRPSVSLAGRIIDTLRPVMPLTASVAVLCPEYAAVRVVASVRLRRGVAALQGRAAVESALEALLHPTLTAEPRWGLALYSSTVVAVLERLPAVDVVTSFELHAEGVATPVDVVEVDPCRGLYCSTGTHEIACEEQL
ncbi:MAG TPA: baseplate J/gp47 family protein [Ornithinibacter sp.]|nr:baseplate J/gp47 family protein [Ornithinibacter sp.]